MATNYLCGDTFTMIADEMNESGKKKGETHDDMDSPFPWKAIGSAYYYKYFCILL